MKAFVMTIMLCFACSLPACGGEYEGAKRADVKRTAMPEGETWSGVYYHPVYGYLHLVNSDGRADIIGRWRRADGSAWGEMSGVHSGAVYHFEWIEHKIGLVGDAADSKGKGYFVYKLGADGQGMLEGEYGLGGDEVGAKWNSVKQKRMSPELKSINGDTQGVTAPTTDGKWQ